MLISVGCINIVQDNNISSQNSDLLVRAFLKPFNSYLNDPDVTEIIINKPGGLFTRQNSMRVDVYHEDETLTYEYLEKLVNIMAAYCGKAMEQSMSLTLPDGERVQVARGSLVYDGYYGINIRKHVEVSFTLDELEAQGAFSSWQDVAPHQYTKPEIDDLWVSKKISVVQYKLLEAKLNKNLKEFLEIAVLNNQNIIVAGKTASGKTTLTRTLINLVPPTQRLITIEDTHELKLEGHHNKLPLIFGEGNGRLSPKEALAACMRLSPDRIFLAELRGDEAWDYLQSLKTGHPGSITSTHANNAMLTFDRVAGLLLQSKVGGQMPYSALMKEVYSCINIVIFMEYRKVTEVFFDPFLLFE